MTDVKARQMATAPGRRARQRAPDAAGRIINTLKYAAAVRELGTPTREVKRMKTSKGRLPGVYPDKGSIVGRR
jgi:hypothetical protein